MSALAGKKIIITGGSRGIGKAAARALLEAGAHVLLIARNQKELDEAKRELEEISPDVYVFAADVSKIEDVKNIGKYIEQIFGGIDVLVNAAGIIKPIGALASLEEGELVESWKYAYAVNVFGTVFMSWMVIPFMKKQGGGRIINFSGGGEGPFPNFSAYASSKGAVARFTETLAAELKNERIRVNVIAPGAVNTKLLEEVLAAGEEKAGKEYYGRALKQKAEGGIAPEKAAELVKFLCSPETEGVTGKFFSAVWDDFDAIVKHKDEIMQTDIYTIRRIKPQDRGCNW